jgi:serpin B
MRLLIFSCWVLIAACSGAGNGANRRGEVSDDVQPTDVTPARENQTAAPSATGNADVAASQTAFAIELYRKLSESEGNLFLSPFSIASVMTMTAGGARGETAEQMAAVLHLPRDFAGAHEAPGRASDALNRAQGIELSTANALWLQKGLNIERGFRSIVEKNYRAGLKDADFRASPEAARNAVNKWVEDETREKIRELIPEGAMDASTRLVLANAIYFKGQWARQFKTRDTRPAAFKLIGGEEVQAPFMFQKQRFPYKAGENYQTLELPYNGNEFSMLIVLPNETNGIQSIEETLSQESARAWSEGMREIEVEVYLPKFTMTSQFSLAATLAAMGMPLAFSDRADFTGITKEEPLMISGVFHKAFVDVNEEGTEAAAATGAVVSVTSAMPQQPVFRADHPFLFFIRERSSGLILFMGRVMDPR